MTGEVTWWQDVRQQALLLLIVAAISGLVAIVVDRYRRRLLRMRWSASHTIVAVSGADPVFGAVEVTHNGVRVSRLYATTVVVTNSSGSDLSSVPITITFPEGTTILQGGGGVVGEPTAAPLSPEFLTEARTIVGTDNPDAHTERRLRFLHRHRPFIVRTMNRRSTARFEFLVDAPAPVSGSCQVTIPMAGVCPVELPANPRQVFGVDVMLASWIGLFVAIAVLLIVGYWYRSPLGLAAIAFVVAGFGQHIGAAVVRATRWARTLLD